MTREGRPRPVPGAPSSKREDFEKEALVHLDALYGFALRFTGGDDADAQDLVQETVLRAWRSWDKYERGTNCRAWLMTILRNTFISSFRRRQRRPSPVDYDDVEEAGIWPQLREEDPEGRFFERIVDERIVQAVEGLPARYRVPLVLSDLQGLSYQEVADEIGVPVGTVKSRLHRARRRLQRELYEYAKSTGYVKEDPVG